MKILAISDWRVQPLEMITKIVETHNPDVILYAGDDLDRFIPLNELLLIKTPNHLLKLNFQDIEPVLVKQNKLITQKFKKYIRKIDSQSNDILQKLGMQFYYVNGNDDYILHIDRTYYLRIPTGYLLINGKLYNIGETSNNKITIEEIDNRSFPFSKDFYLTINENFEKDASHAIRGNIYTAITPSFGRFTVQKKSEKITVFGCECEFGLQSKIKNKPTGYADIYLSHIPPLGTLDLSIRFGIDHIGSRELLDAVNKYHPKLVICGHSHIWGGIYTKIGDTFIINVSSQDRDPSFGNYALIDTNNWSIEMRTIDEKTMRPIRGMGTIRSKLNKKRLNVIRNKKIESMSVNIDEILRDLSSWKLNSVRSLEELYKTIEKIENIGVDTKRIKERIESLKWRKPKIIKNLTINPYKHAFVDVETGLAKGSKPGKLWLIGLLYNEDLLQFLFPKEKEDFFRYLIQNRITSLVSWTRYDRNVLYPILEKRNIKIKFIDACQRTSNCVIWYTYRLHELYNALFTDKNNTIDIIPGHIAGLYADHLILSKEPCPYCPPKEKIIDKIKERNKEDLIQMVEICKLLWNKNENKEYNDLLNDLTKADVEVAVENYRIAMSNRFTGKFVKSHIEKIVENYRQALLKRVKK